MLIRYVLKVFFLYFISQKEKEKKTVTQEQKILIEITMISMLRI
jgi:hypothetical protein